MNQRAIFSTYFMLTILLTSAFVNADAYIPNPDTATMTPAPWVDIIKARRPYPGILTGGQPSLSQLEEAKKKGFKTIINLRAKGENTDWDEEKKVKALGMRYVWIPIPNLDALTIKNSQRLIHALSDIKQYPVMVHCASGYRVRKLFALDAEARTAH